MDSFQFLQTTFVVGIFSFLGIYYLIRRWRHSSIMGNKLKEAPQPAGAWPIIGHLHQLASGNLPHLIFGDMADKYGPAFMIRLGLRRAIIISDWEIAKECFTNNDKVLATRPSSVAVQLMGYDYAMFGLGPYGPYWREVRKIVVLELLSNRRIELLKHIWDSEITMAIKQLYQLCTNQNKGHEPVLVEMSQLFSNMALNLVVRMVNGRICEENEARRYQKIGKNFLRLAGLFVLSDYLPFFGWLDLQGYKKEMKRTAREVDSLLEGWLDEHKNKGKKGGAGGVQDFMDVMLSILKDENLYDYDVDTVNKATCFAIILGGSDTTSVTLSWALALLLNNPQSLKKAQDDLDIHVGKERQVEDSDIKNLIYIQCIIKEAMRLHPVAPLLLPHEAMEDCTIAGYHIPAGTRIIVNAWKIQRDPLIWENATEFQPERFLNRNVDVRGQHFELIPFGSGRRACPGISLALQVVTLCLARLIHGFDLSTATTSPVDMRGSAGIVNAMVNPLEVLVTPRLSPELYA